MNFTQKHTSLPSTPLHTYNKVFIKIFAYGSNHFGQYNDGIHLSIELKSSNCKFSLLSKDKIVANFENIAIAYAKYNKYYVISIVEVNFRSLWLLCLFVFHSLCFPVCLSNDYCSNILGFIP